MKVEGLLFALLAAFLVVSSGIYWDLSRDPTGAVCLAPVRGSCAGSSASPCS